MNYSLGISQSIMDMDNNFFEWYFECFPIPSGIHFSSPSRNEQLFLCNQPSIHR